MIKFCSKCKDKYFTANMGDTLCVHCDGSMPRLTYWDVENK